MSVQLNFEWIHPDNGSSKGPLLVFLHEALGSIGQWKTFPTELCEALQLSGLVYERQGHGKSIPLTTPRTPSYLHDYALKELPTFLDEHISKQRDIILVGHSDGGTIALLYANAFPNRIKGVITMAAHVINEGVTIQGIQPAVEAFEKGKLDGLIRYHGEKTRDLFYAWSDTWRSNDFYHWNIVNDINPTVLPGLFLQGDQDQYGSSLQLDLINGCYTDGEHYLIPCCGHHPHLEQPEKTIKMIKEWYIKSLINH